MFGFRALGPDALASLSAISREMWAVYVNVALRLSSRILQKGALRSPLSCGAPHRCATHPSTVDGAKVQKAFEEFDHYFNAPSLAVCTSVLRVTAAQALIPPPTAPRSQQHP
eukprot:3354102-Pyramimonas_sp.AAC.2